MPDDDKLPTNDGGDDNEKVPETPTNDGD